MSRDTENVTVGNTADHTGKKEPVAPAAAYAHSVRARQLFRCGMAAPMVVRLLYAPCPADAWSIFFLCLWQREGKNIEKLPA